MSGEDDEIPQWARPLTRGPIEVDEQTNADDLSREFSERLEALLQLYGCDATPEGWRDLALRLALEHEITKGQPVMRVVVPVDRQSEVGGAEPGKRWWLAQRLQKRAKSLGSVKAAAKELGKFEGLSVGRLQNLAAEKKAHRVAKPRFMQRQHWEGFIEASLQTAADQIESGHKPERLLS